MNSTLDVQHLSVEFRTPTHSTTILRDVSFQLPAGSTTLVVGESGSGKTTLASALTRLFSQSDQYRCEGNVFFSNVDLIQASPEELRKIRRSGIRYVFQEPAEAFPPLMRVGACIRDALGPDWTKERICTLLEHVDLPQPQEILRSYPHELSGGMLQRVSIAIAIATEPALLLADEPTSALDAPAKWQIVDLLLKLQREGRRTSLIVTHDRDLIDALADHLIILFAGQIVEQMDKRTGFASLKHPYARQLLGFDPVNESKATPRGSAGCAFASRCPIVQNRCLTELPRLEQTDSGAWVRCFYWK